MVSSRSRSISTVWAPFSHREGVVPGPERLGEVPVHGEGHVPRVLVLEPHGDRGVVLDRLDQVAFGLEAHPLLAQPVLEGELVEGVRRPVLRGARDEARARGLARQAVGRRRVAVVEHADDERSVGVPLLELHDDLLPDAGHGEHAPALAGPGHHRAHPAGGALVALALPVPVELHPDAAVLVGVDLLPFRPDHGGGVDPGDLWPGSRERRAVGLALGHRGKGHAVGPLPRRELPGERLHPRQGAVLGEQAQAVRRARDEVARVLRREWVVGELEGGPSGEGADVGLGLHRGVADRLRLHPHSRPALAQGGVAVVAGVVVELVPALAVVALRDRARGREARARAQEVVVVERDLAARGRLARTPGEDVVELRREAPRRAERDARVARHGVVGRRAVGQDHPLAPVALDEEPVDPLFLHQPGEEGEVRLAVLHDVVALGVGSAQTVLDLARASMLGEDPPHQIRHRDPLEHARVGRARQEPGPGAQLGAVVSATAPLAQPLHRDAGPGKPPHAPARRVHHDPDVPAEDVGQHERTVGRDELDLRPADPAHPLLDARGEEVERVARILPFHADRVGAGVGHAVSHGPAPARAAVRGRARPRARRGRSGSRRRRPRPRRRRARRAGPRASG